MGLLGPDYPGYFPVENEIALANALQKAETEPYFLRDLKAFGKRVQRAFLPEREAAAWLQVVNLVTRPE